uniref:Amino acid ABC transporter permease n=1 Tax=Romanomermis culicivorax TaxID=13658 RepID=A0A915HRZ0_ROMCU
LIVEENVTISDEDKFGPLSEVLREVGTDYYLVASWYFIAFCGLYYFLTSSLAARFVDTMKRNWREMNEE